MRITDWLGMKPLSFIILLFIALLSAMSVSAKTAAGTVITNQAEISWIDGRTGDLETAFSNESTVIVGSQYDLLLTENQTVNTYADSAVSLSHSLTNTGNTASGYEIRVFNANEELSTLKVFGDTNANGQVDEGENVWTAIPCEPLEDNVSCYFVPEMQPDETTDFVLIGSTPVDVLVDGQYDINIRAFPDNYESTFSSIAEFTTAIKSLLEAEADTDDWVNNDIINIDIINIGHVIAEITFLYNNSGSDTPSFYDDEDGTSDFAIANEYTLDGIGYDTITDGVYIELLTNVVNQDSSTAETIEVLVTAPDGDTLLVTLLETGDDTDVFRSLAPIRMSTTESGDDKSCPSTSSIVPNYTVEDEACVLSGSDSDSGNDSIVVTIPISSDFHSILSNFNLQSINDTADLVESDINTDFMLDKTASVSEVSIGGFVTYTIEIENDSDNDLSNVEIYDDLPYGFSFVEGSVTLDDVELPDYSPEGASGSNLNFSNLPFVEDSVGVISANEDHTLTYVVRTTAGAVNSNGINTAQAAWRIGTGELEISRISRATVEISREGVLSDKGIVFGKVFVDADCNNIQNGGEWPIGGVKVYFNNGTWAITDSNGQYSIYGLDPGSHVVRMDPITLPEGLIFKPTDNRQMADPTSRWIDLTSGDFHRADFAAVCPKDKREEIYAEIKARNQGQTDWLLENAQNYNPDRTVTSDSQLTAEANGDISNGTDSEQKRTLRLAKKNQSQLKKSLTIGYSIQISQFREKALAVKALSELSVNTRKSAFVHQAGDFYTVRHGFSLYKKEITDLYKTMALDDDARVVSTVYEQISDEVADQLETPRGLETMILAKDAIKTVNRTQAKEGVWLWPKDNVSLDGRFMVTVRKGVTPTLLVNGKPVPQSQIGEQIENRKEKAQVAAWYGVQLQPGKNELEVTAKDPFGNKRVLAKGEFTRPVSAEKLEIVTSIKTLPADGGRSYLPVTIKLLDENGYLARGVNFVSIESSDGQWVERDIQDKTQGHQVRVVNGLRVVHLKSSEHSGDVLIRAVDGSMRDEIQITQTALLRPLISVGLIEVGMSRFNRDINSPNASDEEEVDARLAAFAKGRVRGDFHLTMSIDTDKDDDAELFRDINPNDTYPIFGDSSQRGYEAQSRSKVYAKLEKDDDSITWGDFVTDGNAINEDVTRVQRTLTGLNIVGQNDKNEWQIFVSEQDEEHVVEQIRGEGVALNYELNDARDSSIVKNSETIEIITISRDNSGVVLSTEELTRFGDYTLDEVTGDLSFSEVVPSTDEDSNPVFIRASYDLEESTDDYIVAGARFTHEIKEDFKVGLSYTLDQDATTGFELYGALLDFKDDNGLTVRGSIAQMTHEDESIADGVAGRLYLLKEWDKKSQTSLTLGRASEGFTNSVSGISENREELNLKHKQKLSNKMSVEVEAIHSRDLDTDDQEQSIGVTADVKVKDWTLTGGVRHIEEKTSTEDEEYQTFIIGAKHSLNLLGKKGSLGAEYEQDFDDTNRRLISLTADLQVHDKVKLYAKGERIESLTDDSSDTFSIGVKSDIMKSTELYSEYRVRGVTDGRDLETVSGIRGTYELTKGLSIAPHLEYVRSIDGDDGDSIAASIAVKDSRFEDQLSNLRLEARHDDDRTYYGLEANYVKRLDNNWSLLFKDTLTYESPDDDDNEIENTLTLGLAYRPRTDNKHHGLFFYQNIEERGGDEGDCNTHVFSTHQNYAMKDDVLLSGRLGGKRENCDDFTTDAVIVDGRMTWDITNRFDLDLHAGALGTDGANEVQYSFGAGINYLVKENLRFGIGYNVAGFDDNDLDPENYNDEGLYLGLQYKFDENSLNWLTGEK